MERLAGTLVVGAVASIGAGLIHGAAVGVHAEARQASLVFAAIAAFQIGWAVVVLAAPLRPSVRMVVAASGAVANIALVVGWYVATERGVSFIEGLEVAHGATTTDVVGAILAGVSALAVGLAVVAGRRGPALLSRPLGAVGLSVVALAALAAVTPGMVAASDHAGHDHSAGGDDHGDHDDHDHADAGDADAGAADDHDDHDDHDHDDEEHGDVSVADDGDQSDHDHADHAEYASAPTRLVEVCETVEGEPDVHEHDDGSTHVHDDEPVPEATEVCEMVETTAYHPDHPIDLGGMPGVTLEQQAAAENLIAVTLAHLPDYADVDDAVAAGYYSFGDGSTGHEHYLNWDLVDDGRILDPQYPESLVYDTTGGEKRLVSAMFMLDSDDTLATVPDVGGALMQWHVHGDICMSGGEQPRLTGLRAIGGECGTGVGFPPIPMIHVWIEPNECGPFAALEGVGAGQVAEDEEKLCDHAHGGH